MVVDMRSRKGITGTDRCAAKKAAASRSVFGAPARKGARTTRGRTRSVAFSFSRGPPGPQTKDKQTGHTQYGDKRAYASHSVALSGAPLGAGVAGATSASEASRGPAGMRVVDRVEGVAALAACRPARATDGAGPGVAHTHVGTALLQGGRVPGARATVPVGIVARRVFEVGVRRGAGGVGGEPVMGQSDTRPCQRVTVVVANAGVERVAGWRPRLGSPCGSIGERIRAHRAAGGRCRGAGALRRGQLAGGAMSGRWVEGAPGAPVAAAELLRRALAGAGAAAA